MTYQEALSTVEDLRARYNTGFSNQDKEVIASLYGELLGRVFVKTGCSDCYRDALVEIHNHLKREGKMKDKCDYTLKNGVVLQPFGTSEVYTNANLTNEVAEKHLRQFPAAVNLFAHTPSDLEERLAKEPGDTKTQAKQSAVLNDELVKELAEKLAADGTTKKAVKEEYKEYEIDGKKITGTLLDAHIKAAEELNKNAAPANGGENKGGE